MNTLGTTSRRGFLGATAGWVAAGAAMAVEPFVRVGPPRLRLSLAAYSFRDEFRDHPGGIRTQGPGGRPVIDMQEFIDYCAAHGCDGAELTSYYFPKDVDDAYLLLVRRQAFLRGVSVSGTAVGNTFTLPDGERRKREVESVKGWIARAAVLGAPHVRVFAGNAEGAELAVAKRRCIEALEECGEVAGRAGVFLGLENHGGIVAEVGDLLDIVRAVRSPWVGINLDSGNFHTDDPYADLARCVPYAVNVQLKVEMRRRGQAVEASDLGRLVAMLREGGYQGWVVLEYEAKEDPRLAVPRYLGQLRRLLQSSAA